MPKPRTRDDRLKRDRIKVTDQVGSESMPLTCPRCGWPCTHLCPIHAWESPWMGHGGTCAECITEAVDHFDKVGWPPNPELEASSQGSDVEEEEPEQYQLIDPGEALPADQLPKGRSKAGAPKRRPRR